MEQAENDNLMRFLRQGVSNFLAGIFLIVTVLQLPTTGIDVESAKYISWAIGGAFIIVAFGIIVAL